ncbi:MAG: rhodanese-like domain-containing protein [Polyangiaceae bacterium]
MVSAPGSAPLAPPSDVVIVFAVNLDRPDPARDALIGLCERHGHTPLLLDAAIDPIFAEHVKDPQVLAHFPLLCVRGSLVGGVDAVSALDARGALASLLSPLRQQAVPRIALSRTAAEQLRKAMSEPGACLRIAIGASFEHELTIDAPAPDDLHLALGDFECVLDPESAERADGLAIDWVDTNGVHGFRIDNPNQPEPLKWVDLPWIAERTANRAAEGPEGDASFLLIDVRTRREFDASPLPGATLLDGALMDRLETLDRRHPLVFFCNNGIRSEKAAERYRELGFRSVHCLRGGLEGTPERN